MRCLILDRPPGRGHAWLGGATWHVEAPRGDALALHLPRAAPLATLVARGEGEARLPGGLLQAGWVELPFAGPLALHAEGAPLRLSLGEGRAGGLPALRVWEGEAEAEAPWRAARIWGKGAVAVLGAGRVRPVLRLDAGEAAWVVLPRMTFLPAPRLEVLRGPPPRAATRWGLPHAPTAPGIGPGGPGPVTLVLRASLACEVVWEG